MGAEDIKQTESDESISKHARSEDYETLKVSSETSNVSSEKSKVSSETSKDESTNKSLALLPKEKVINCTSPSDETMQLQDPASEKKYDDSFGRDVHLVHVITQKKLALVKAWEESKKTKANNRANKKVLAAGSWKDSKNASVDAQLTKIEEKYERKKAKCAEKMHNKKAEIHKKAEEKKAIVDAQRSQSFLKIQESAAKFRATGKIPKNLFPCFGFWSHK